LALRGLLLRTSSVVSSKIESINERVDDYARALHGSQANASAVSMVAASQALESLIAAVTASWNIKLQDLLSAHGRLSRTSGCAEWRGTSDIEMVRFLVPSRRRHGCHGK
jgi:hypothetical protein